MLHRTIYISIRTAARCSFPHRCTASRSSRHLLTVGDVQTLTTRRTTTDARSHGKEHSGLNHDAAVDDNGGWPYPIHTSARTSAKKSVFVAHASRLPSAPPAAALRAFLDHLTAQPALKRATHCMYAWRVVVASQHGSVTTNSDTNAQGLGLGGAVLTGQSDGGENGAGERLARLLEATGCANVVVVVSRWYGGVKLGSERWKMISAVAKDALAQGDFREGNMSTAGTHTGTTRANAKGSDNKKKRKK